MLEFGLMRTKNLVRVERHLRIRTATVALLCLLCAQWSNAAVVVVGSPAESIQVAIDAAVDGDTVLVAPGTYNEMLTIADKSIVLASLFEFTNDPAHIEQTIVSGAGLGVGGLSALAVITIAATAGENTRIVGLTIRDGQDGISPFTSAEYDHIRVTATGDGIDFEIGTHSWVHDSTFDLNLDDGLDLDRAVGGLFENNVINNNGDDGIEIRLNNYGGPMLFIEIVGNEISGNGEDGIQLIDDTLLSQRTFRIEDNLISNNVDVGIGMMCCQISAEDFSGASIPERIELVGNTIVGNGHGVTGGDNLISVNNIIAYSTDVGLKNADGDSVAAHNLFFGNGTDLSGSNFDAPTTITANPMLMPNNQLAPRSPAIDEGAIQFQVGMEVIVDLPPLSYEGEAPDLGAFEFVQSAPVVPAVSRIGQMIAVLMMGFLGIWMARRPA